MYLSRHRDMLGDVALDTPIVIIGAGSIGSYACLALTKLGFNNITIADDGIIEEENIAPQFYSLRDIGKLKVDCLKRSIKNLTGVDIITVPARIDRNNQSIIPNGFLILAVDSMSARKELSSLPWTHLIDSRMAIEFLTVISVAYRNIHDVTTYRETLFDDSDAVQEACTNKAISYTSLIAGAMVAKRVLDMLKGDHQFTTINFDINSFDMIKLS